MSGYEKLEKLLKSTGGIITAKQARENDIHNEYLREYVKQGKLERVARGVYVLQNNWVDNLYITQLMREKAVYSHETALYVHDLTDRDPLYYSVTVPDDYNASRLKKESLKIYYVKKDLFNLGLSTSQTQYSNNIRVYDMERTICDILRDRNNQDPAIVSEALKRYTKRKDKDINKLMKYAKKFRVEKVLRQYLEVLL